MSPDQAALEGLDMAHDDSTSTRSRTRSSAVVGVHFRVVELYLGADEASEAKILGFCDFGAVSPFKKSFERSNQHMHQKTQEPSPA